MPSGALAFGKNTTFKVYFNNTPWLVITKTWRVTEQAVEATDGINGEQRDRLQKVTQFYRCTFDCYDDGSSNNLQNLITNQLQEDAQLPDLPLSGGLIFTYPALAGARKAFVLKNCTMGPLDIGSSGRTTAINSALSFRAQYFAAVAAA